jgi:protein-tyrosine sulfotransferase
MAPYTSGERHIVMGGAPRSGTTLLRRIFDKHPAVAAGPESKLFVPAAFNLEWLAQGYSIPLGELVVLRDESESQAAFIDAFAARVRADTGKSRWAEKTPMNIRNLDWIGSRWPESSVVHIIRDGRDVVCSVRQHPDWRWRDGGWQKVLVPRPVDTYAQRWVTDTAMGMAWRDHPTYVEVRYEDLVADPEPVLRAICLGIDIDVDTDWLADVTSSAPATDAAARPDDKGALTTASVGRWRTDLSPDEADEVTRICGPRLAELGYPLETAGAT